jgi:hypothetical protein
MGRLVVTLGLLCAISLGSAGRSAGEERNKCGCYKDGAGNCYCDKKAKCGCPGECEPKGCEAQREKELQKEIDAETKKATESQHKRAAPSEESGSDDDDRPAKAPAPTAHKLTAAQAKQLAKLLDLYLGDHPDARGRAIEDVRNDLSR